MVYFRTCPRALSSALVAVTLLAMFLLVKHSKQFYEEHQKFRRLKIYLQYMEEVSSAMAQAEKAARLGTNQLEQLNRALETSVFNRSAVQQAR